MRRFALLAAACVAPAALSLALPSSPTYDPWAWIVWGREIVELDLDTRYGPSWKPLPVLFTTPFALLGDAAPALWLVVSRAGAVFAVVMAYRVAGRLAGGGRAGMLAGIAAAIGVVFTEGWLRNGTLGNSEGLLVGLVLLAVDRHLDGARGQAFGAAFGAALLRPEVWPFFGLYALYLWLRDRPLRPLVAALLASLPILWFVPDYLATGELLRSSERAQDPNPGSPAFAERPALEVASRAVDLPLEAVVAGFAAALAFALADRRRDERASVLLALTLGILALVGVVALMTEAGYSGNLRYLILPAALTAVAAAVGLVRLGETIAGRLASARAGLVAGVVLGAALLASAAPRAAALPDEVEALAYQGRLYDDLGRAVANAERDGAVDCGRPVTGAFHVPAVAWQLRVHTGEVSLEPEPPTIVFRAPTARGQDADPSLPASATFRPVAREGEWEVFATCPEGP